MRPSISPSLPSAPERPRHGAWAGIALLSGVLLLTGCGADGVDPADAETGVPLNSGPADPAASPAESDDPLTGSSP